MSNVWRVRMHAGEFGDYSEEAWQRGEIGVWYGGWSADDFLRARNSPEGHRTLSQSAGHQPIRKHWGSPGDVPKSFFDTAVRFAAIPERDWILLAFKAPSSGNDKPSYCLGLGHLDNELLSDEEHAFNLQYSPNAKELFKFRRLRSRKQFRLSKLPEVFRLIPQTGRGNIFKFGDLNTIVIWLVHAESEDDVWSHFRALPLAEMISALGPKGWEALAEAYLILEERYVPVGLVVGKTLKTFDLLGRSLRDGARLVASCKNERRPIALPEEFRDAILDMSPPDRAYFFAYGGCSDATWPENLTVVDGGRIVEWLEKGELGRKYLSFLQGTRPS